MKGPGPPAQSSPSYRTEQTLPVTPHLGTTPQTLGASRPPGPSAYMLCLRSASAYRLYCYAEAQLAGQHALLKPLDDPVELSPGQVKRNAGGCCRAQVKAEPGPEEQGQAAERRRARTSARPGPTRAARRLLFFALLTLLSTATAQRVATLLCKVQRCRAWWLERLSIRNVGRGWCQCRGLSLRAARLLLQSAECHPSQPCQAQEAQAR